MAKDKIAYVCSNCGQESPKWIGKCPACGQWNTFKEIRVAGDTGSRAAHAAAATLRSGTVSHTKDNKVLRLRDIFTPASSQAGIIAFKKYVRFSNSFSCVIPLYSSRSALSSSIE